MWFKQITCDGCFNNLVSIGRHNKYYVANVLNFNGHEICQNRFYADSMKCEISVGDRTFLYLLEKLDARKWLTFCCFSCAEKYSKSKNCCLFYYDEQLCSVAYITPHQAEINQMIGNPNNPILYDKILEWDWFCQFYDTIDLSQYAGNTTFPVLNLREVKLVAPTIYTLKEMAFMISSPTFMKSYFGYFNSDMAEKNKSCYLNNTELNLKELEEAYGRRAKIEWHIVDSYDYFIGFLHLTKLSHYFPDKWVLQFGLKPEFENKGIMTMCLLAALKWAKSEGCSDIYAISEIYNKASYALFQKLPYCVEKTVSIMFDQYAGNREMFVYHITL